MKFKSTITCLFVIQFVLAGDSGIPGAFTDVGYSVKSISMGSVQSTLNQDAMGVMLNPASLTTQESNHSLYFNSFSSENIKETPLK